MLQLLSLSCEPGDCRLAMMTSHDAVAVAHAPSSHARVTASNGADHRRTADSEANLEVRVIRTTVDIGSRHMVPV